ncbi:hypothetical protein Acr_17g0011270 [Actinidia rufa]|uniref:CCHC-type domain-containing protein n=1 Tax=Actinidia rufa TaxID=165716 RepID=A0A7J0G438_9ERIC|nr:hypothetical protein Acr_17g0011270 [Actinidia rufa]
MDNTRGSGQEGGNDNPQMTELRNMVQMLGGMDPVKANDWILAMEKNFRLLRCGEQQKVEIGSYLLAGEASRWWNLKGVKEPGMDWARFKNYEGSFTNLAEYAPHLVATDEMRARRFEDGLRHEIKRVIRPLVLPTYAEVLDRAIIVEQDEIERKKYFDSKRRQNFGGEGTSGQKKQKPEMKSRNFGNNPKGQVQMFHCNEVGHIKRNCPRLRTEAVAPRGGPGGGNVRLVGNARLGGNRPGNPGNRDGNVNNQRQGRAFALMPGDARNTEDVVAAVVLGSSIAGRSRELQEEVMTQQAHIGSIRDEMVWAQNVAKELESRITELEAKKQHTVEELRR